MNQVDTLSELGAIRCTLRETLREVDSLIKSVAAPQSEREVRLKGASYNKASRKWRCQFYNKQERKVYQLGLFTTEQEAHNRWKQEALKHGYITEAD